MILLTTPVDPGAHDPGKTYTHIKIAHLDIYLESRNLNFACNGGYLVGGEYQWGAMEVMETNKTFGIHEADFDNIVANTLTTAAGVRVYDEVANALYQWLLDNGHFAGTLV